MFEKIVVDLAAFKAALASKKPGDILRASGELVKDAGDVYDVFGSGKVFVISGEDQTKAIALIDGCCVELEGFTLEEGNVGAFGDGKFFTIILQNMPAILEAIRKFIKQ